MKKFLRKTLRYLPILIPIIIAGFVVAHDYQPHTYLSGWDTLHPEFNLKLYTERVINGAWQEHQGLGAPAAQAHSAELPRLPLLWILHWLLPESDVRYAFFYLSYILGGLGAYVFICYGWFEKSKYKYSQWAASVGAVFYLLNLSTAQHFAVPLEMFAVHFATLGFILLFFYRAIKYGNRADLLLFFALQFLSGPSAHTATLFYAVNVCIFLWGAVLVLHEKTQLRAGFARLALLGLITLGANLYWILPNFYYIANHSDYVSEAKISRSFSGEAFWQNQSFGEIQYVLILKNFLFNWKVYDFSQKEFSELLLHWHKHLQVDTGLVGQYLLVLMWLASLPIIFLSHSQKHKRAFAVMLGLPLFFIINLNFPFTHIFQLLHNNSKILEEGLRFPFTKFSIILSFGFSIFMAEFTAWAMKVASFANRVGSKKIFASAIYIIVLSLILYANKPFFETGLVHDSMKISHPDYYHELFAWFETQPQEVRVLKLPMASFWGWNYYDWSSYADNAQGYQGAGFTWFGIPQPTIDREFDRWAPTNEYVYHELAHAIKSKDVELFNSILDKYQIGLILYDQTIINPNENSTNYAAEANLFLVNNPKISLSEDFGGAQVYRYASQNQSWVYSKAAQVTVGNTLLSRLDPIYASFQGYFSSETNPEVSYPFPNITAERVKNVTSIESSVTFVGEVAHQGSLNIPSWTDFYSSLPVRLTASYDADSTVLQLSFQTQYPTIELENKIINLNDQIPSILFQKNLVASELSTILALQANNSFHVINFDENFASSSLVYLPIAEDIQFELFAAEKAEIVDNVQNIKLRKNIGGWETTSKEMSQLLLRNLQFKDAPSGKIMVTVPKLEQASTSFINHLVSDPQNCNNKIGTAHTAIDDSVLFVSKDKGIGCQQYKYSNLQGIPEWLMAIDSQNIEGMPLKFIVDSDQKNSPYLQESMKKAGGTEYFSLLNQQGNENINVHFSSISFGSIQTTNSLNSIELYPAPLSWISAIHSDHPTTSNQTRISHIINSERINSALYTAKVSNAEDNSIIVLSQSYGTGWIALANPMKMQKIDHGTHNGWANAWLLPKGEYRVIFVYWPQLIGYAGYVILALAPILVWHIRNQRSMSATHPIEEVKKVLLGNTK